MMVLGVLKKPAKLWKRGFAFVIDLFILNLIVSYPFKSRIDNLMPESGNFFDIYHFLVNNMDKAYNLMFIFGIIGIFNIIYWAFLEYKLEQSIGKMIMGIYVKSKIKKLSLKQCLIRNLSKISLITLFLDCLPLLFTKSKQRYTERLAETEVLAK